MKIRNLLLFQVFVLAMVSCSDRLSSDEAWEQGVMATLPSYVDKAGTKVTFSNNLATFYWSNGDCIGVCRSSSTSNGTAAFTLLKGGATTGNFINDSFSLLPETDYFAFYPFAAGTTAAAYPIKLMNQLQKANNDVSHIGEFNYMATKFTTDSEGKASFTFSNIGTVIQIHFAAEAEDTYKSLTITSSGTPFITQASYNLTNGTFASTGTSGVFQVSFGEGMHVYNGESVVVSAIILPCDMSESTLTFTVRNASGVVKEFSMAGYAFSTGKLYHFYEDQAKGNPPYGGCPDGNHPHAIDLGLPSGTLWSCMNLGADLPTDKGIAFAWGQTDYVEKNSSTWANYEFMNEAYNNEWGITKYQKDDSQTDGCWYNEEGVFIGDGKTTLEMIDDAARQNWGGKWRIPTKKETEELVNYTRYTFTENYNEQGKRGIVFHKKKANGEYSMWDAHIFLPVTYRIDSGTPANHGWDQSYWASDLSKTTSGYNMYFSYKSYYNSLTASFGGRSRIDKSILRPVASKTQ